MLIKILLFLIVINLGIVMNWLVDGYKTIHTEFSLWVFVLVGCGIMSYYRNVNPMSIGFIIMIVSLYTALNYRENNL